MPRYFYKAKNLRGKEESAVLEAASKEHLANILRKKGFFLVSVEGDNSSGKEKRFKLDFSRFAFGVSLKEKLFFTRNMEIMIKTGVPLPRALHTLAKQSKNNKFRHILQKVSEGIIKGKSLSQSMSQYPKVFSNLYRETLKVGEETGKLDESFHTLEEQMARENRLRSQIKTAMIYPALVMCVAFLIGILMIVFAVPKMKQAFEELGVVLPLTTRLILGFADFISKKWYLAFPLLILLVCFILVLLKSKKGNRIKSLIFLKIPVLANISRQTNSALALRTLSALLRAGVPIVRALEVAAGSLGNTYFKQALLDAGQKEKKGSSMSKALQAHEGLYSSMVIQMIEVGEETGETPEVLSKLANFYEEEVTSATKKLSSIVEPLLILLIGGVVGLFAVSMMQPMFSVMSGVH